MYPTEPKSHYFFLLKAAFPFRRKSLYVLTPIIAFLPFLFLKKDTFNTKKSISLASTVQTTTSSEENLPYRIKKIVLDAGHGGNDTGCHTDYGVEKKNTLAITLRLGALIKAQFPDIEIIYTRNSDAFIPLIERANIANKAKADLFISIHCNSTDEGSGAYGTETYVLGNHRKDDNFEVARRENQSIFLESDYKTQYDGFDPNSTEAYIIFSLFQNAYLDKSIVFARYVEDNLQSHANRKSLGVKQAGFLVLKETAMPSVLIETGFLNHARDGAFISSETGQETIAEAIFKSVAQFKKTVEDNGIDRAIANNTNVAADIPSKKNFKTETPTENKNESVSFAKLPEKSTDEIKKPVVSTAKINLNKAVKSEFKAQENAVPARVLENELTYKIQLSVENNDVRATPRFKSLGTLEVLKEGKVCKILKNIGSDYCEAAKAARTIRQKGFDDAFVVAYQNGVRVKVVAEKCGAF